MHTSCAHCPCICLLFFQSLIEQAYQHAPVLSAVIVFFDKYPQALIRWRALNFPKRKKVPWGYGGYNSHIIWRPGISKHPRVPIGSGKEVAETYEVTAVARNRYARVFKLEPSYRLGSFVTVCTYCTVRNERTVCTRLSDFLPDRSHGFKSDDQNVRLRSADFS